MTTRHLGYCTNVHAGNDLPTTKSALEQNAVRVREQLSATSPLPVGLWVSSSTLQDIQRWGSATEWASWLAGLFLRPYTLNGFPHGDFHERTVKHKVYQPTWMEPARLEYTLGLIELLDQLLPAGEFGSISTLPIAWGQPELGAEQEQAAAEALLRVAERLRVLEDTSGRRISVAIEPEPGCVFDKSQDIVRFFERYFDSEMARRYLGVCHDVCHASVMFEPQADVIRNYRSNGIHISKLQVSSNVHMVLDNTTGESERNEARQQLGAFAEDRYLHQTCVSIDGASPQFFEDLPLALEHVDVHQGSQDWRVHFHVPIHIKSFGALETGQQEIRECLAAVDLEDEALHIEVETYAWNVLPVKLRPDNLADGIANELRWLNKELGLVV